MSKDTTPPAEPKAPPADLICEILENGIIINGSHHAKGKVMALTDAQASALKKLDPPAIKILGV